jgi:short-subunit dehydrogenase
LPNTLLTGASSGIGNSLARKMARHGDAVIVMARRRAELDQLVAGITASGGKAAALACDVTDHDAVIAAAREAAEIFGPIERLIANAGGGKRTPAEGFSARDIDEMFRLNVVGVANCIEAVLPSMLQSRRGHIVVTGSLAGSVGLPKAGGYSASKAALRILVDSLRSEVARKGIDVTYLAPGFVRTHEHKKSRPFEMDLERATDIMADAIVQRVSYYAFPKSLAIPLALLRLLPTGARSRFLGLLQRD